MERKGTGNYARCARCAIFLEASLMPCPTPAARLLNSDTTNGPGPGEPPAAPYAPRDSRVRSRQDDGWCRGRSIAGDRASRGRREAGCGWG